MAQMAFDGDIAYGWELWLGREASPGGGTYNWTQIYGITDLPFPEREPEKIDVTHMQSPGRTREEVPGLLSTSDWSQEKQYWANNAGDIALEALAQLTDAGTKEDVLLEFVAKSKSGSVRRTYRGYVSQYTPTGSVGDVANANLTFTIMDQVANVRTPVAS